MGDLVFLLLVAAVALGVGIAFGRVLLAPRIGRALDSREASADAREDADGRPS
jgi:hypothetical protein